MYQVPLATSSTIINREDFWNSLTLYHKRPHLVNRKIIAADQVLFVSTELKNPAEIFSNHALTYEIRKFEELKKEFITENLLNNLLNTQTTKLISINKFDNLNELNESIYLSVRIIQPRMRNYTKCVELVVIDKIKDNVTSFVASFEKDKMIPLPSFSYRIELTKDNFMRITVDNFEHADTSSAEWLAGPLFTKLFKWTESLNENTLQSLSQISIEKYCNLYEILKEKYGKPLVKVWRDETKTDPQKFIFEDLAIASYVICIWKKEYNEEAEKVVNFVDCGCGNGLLVYILNQEGFKGFGIDIRRRNVWDLFEKTSDLRVGVVSPNSVFPEATWLIGNHSDELTPWLPLIASRSSPKTNYFVIPCCPYDFNGKKYIRTNTSKSQYADYLDYIRNISEKCGFLTSLDKLRIPSTKRVGLIGIQSSNCSDAEDFINSKLTQDFTPRASVEKVRNCTQIDSNIKNSLIEKIVGFLLLKENFLLKSDGTSWNKGGEIHLNEFSKLLPRKELIHLKKECGGLQTLLRNHRYIFVLENANVSLRKPFELNETDKYKDKPCWFNLNHVNGCLYDSDICAYKHLNK